MVKGYLPIALPPPLLSAFAQTSLLFLRPLKTYLTEIQAVHMWALIWKRHFCLAVCQFRLQAHFERFTPLLLMPVAQEILLYVVLQGMPQTRVPIGMEYREYKQYSTSRQIFLVQGEEDLSCVDGSHARASLMPNQPPSSSHIAGLPHILGFGGGEKREEEIAPPPSSPRGYRFPDIPHISPENAEQTCSSLANLLLFSPWPWACVSV